MLNAIEGKCRENKFRIFDAFFRSNPTSLLIKGDPGAGKTTLSLELLDHMKEVYKGFYISTRVSYEKLVQQLPWCKELLSDESVLRPFSSTSASIPLVDVRLGSINSIVELVMSAVMKKRAFIILDSWDALAKEADMKERLKAEKTLVSIADANESFLVFISEEPHLTTVSYLVDGVVTLEYNNGIRSLRIDKLRGSTIEDKRIFYTLDSGRFTPIYKPTNLKPSKCNLFEPIENGNAVSTGNRYLDKAIRGVRRGNVILLETSINRDRRILGLILSSMILNYLRDGGSAIVINTSDRPYTTILNHLRSYCSEEDLERLVIADEGVPDLPYLANISYSNLRESCSILLSRYSMLKSKSSKPTLLTMDVGLCETHLSDEQFITFKNNLLRLQNIFRTNEDNIVFVNVNGYRSFPLLQSTMDIHLKLYTEDGVSFIQTIKPYNGIYGIEVDTSKGYPSYRLRKMV